jgi:hypothetical protein
VVIRTTAARHPLLAFRGADRAEDHRPRRDLPIQASCALRPEQRPVLPPALGDSVGVVLAPSRRASGVAPLGEWRRVALPLPPPPARLRARGILSRAMGRRRHVPRSPVPPIARSDDDTLRRGRGVILRFPSPRAGAPRNAAWDDLLALAQRAWACRDPDSLSAVAACVLRLAGDIAPEWTGRAKDA